MPPLSFYFIEIDKKKNSYYITFFPLRENVFQNDFVCAPIQDLIYDLWSDSYDALLNDFYAHDVPNVVGLFFYYASDYVAFDP